MAVALFRFAGAIGGERDATLEFRRDRGLVLLRRDRGLVLLQMQLRSADETVVLRSFTETGADEESFPLPRILVPASGASSSRFDVLFQVDDTAVTFLNAQDMTVIHAFRHRAPFARASVKVGGECRLTRVIQIPSATARSVDVAIPASMWERQGWAFRVTQDGEAPIFTVEWMPAGPRLHCCHGFKVTPVPPGATSTTAPSYTAATRTRVSLSAEVPLASEPTGASQPIMLTLVFEAAEEDDDATSAPSSTAVGVASAAPAAAPAAAVAKRASRRVSIVSRAHGTLFETIVPWTAPTAAVAASSGGALAPAASSVAFLDIPHHIAAAVVGAGGTSSLTASALAAGTSAAGVATGGAAALASLATPPPTPAGKVSSSASTALSDQHPSHDSEAASTRPPVSGDAPSTPVRSAHSATGHVRHSTSAADASASDASAAVPPLHVSDAAAAPGQSASSLSSISSSRPRTPPHAQAPTSLPHFAPHSAASAPSSRFVSPRQSARTPAAAHASRPHTARVTPGDFPYSCILDILHGNMETISGLSAAELDAWLVWLGHAKAAVKAQRLTTLLQEHAAAYDGGGAVDHSMYAAPSDGDRHMSASGSFSSLSMHAHTPILTAHAYRASQQPPAIEEPVPDAVASGGVGGAGATTILASYFSSPPPAPTAPQHADGTSAATVDSKVDEDAATSGAVSPRSQAVAAVPHGHRASAADTRAAAVL